MVGIDHQVELVSHLAVEAHFGIDFGHILHTTHELGTCNQERVGLFTQGFERNHVHAAILGQLRIENAPQIVLFLLAQAYNLGFLLGNQLVDYVRIHAREPEIRVLLLHEVDERRVEDPVHDQDIVTLGLGRLDIAVFAVHLGSIQEYQLLILVGLQIGNHLLVFIQAEILAVGVLEQIELHGPFGKFLIGEDAVLDKNLQVVPFAFKIGTLVLEQVRQAVGHLLGDVVRNLLHVAVALQVGTRHVQRNVRRIDDPVQQCQVFRHDAFHRVGHIHLVAVKLDLVLLQLQTG